MMIIAWSFFLFNNRKPGYGKATFSEEGSEHSYPKSDSVTIDFERLNNDSIRLPEKIMDQISSKLKGYNWNEAFGKETISYIYNEAVLAQYYPSEQSLSPKYIIVIFTNYAGNHYHSAAGRISLFEFQKTAQEWQLARYFPAFGYGDEFGFEPRGMELAQIGAGNNYALIVHTGYSNMGHDRETKTIYAQVDSLWLPVFEFTSYESCYNPPEDFKYDDSYVEMRIINTGKIWFDIETKTAFAGWDEGDEGGVRRFHFERNRYVEKK